MSVTYSLAVLGCFQSHLCFRVHLLLHELHIGDSSMCITEKTLLIQGLQLQVLFLLWSVYHFFFLQMLL